MRTLCLAILVAGLSYAQSQGQTNGNATIPSPREVKAQLTRHEQAWLKAHPEVRWGVDPDWPPFSGPDQNKDLEGIDIDITHLVAKRAGMRVTQTSTKSWSEALEKAEAGKIDFLSATARITGRMESFNYSTAYCSFPVIIVTRSDGPFLTQELNLGGLKVATPRDYVTTMQLEKDYPGAKFILTDTVEDALRLVADRKADATVVNLAVATCLIHLEGLTNLKIAGVTHYEFPLHFAVRKDEPELLSILNKGLATITMHEAEEIYAAHLTPDIAKARDWAEWRRKAMRRGIIALAAILVAGLIFIWNRFLVRQIQYRRTAETALQGVRDRLERRKQELAMRVREEEELNTRLQAANQDLEAFSSSVSHDLRAPLHRITGFIELLRDETEGRLNEEARGWLAVIVNEGRRMDKLITDLLAFARLGRTELHTQVINMPELVNSAINDFKPQLRERKVVWKIGRMGKVDGDPNLLHQALANLIDNALKYTRRRPETEIKIDVLPERGQSADEAVFYVQDNGCGFDMKSAKNLFSPFQRLHSTSEYEGTGIGLANVQKIIQRHGGRIWYESEPDKGATFYFALPAHGRG